MRIVYFYAKDGKKIGPLSREQLDDLRLTPDTLVWHYGLTGWIPYKNLPKPVAPKDESSPFDKFLTWLKSKKKESAPKVEVKPTPIVETVKEEPVTPTVSETPAEPVVKPVVDHAALVQIELQKEARRTKIFNGLKKFFIGLLILVAVGGIIVGSLYAYDYYQNTYLPEKYLKEACAELETRWSDAKGQAKIDMALNILSKDTKWGYENVPNSKIDAIFAAPKRKAALRVIEDDAYSGNASSQFLMGQLYGIEDKYYMNLDYTKAAYWWNEAGLNGNAGGYCNLGWAYMTGHGVKENKIKGVEYYRKAVAGNDTQAMYNLGWCYKNGVKVESGYHYEQYRLRGLNNSPKYYDDIFVRSYWTGDDFFEIYKRKVTDYKTVVPKDVTKARELWKKAAALGHEDSRKELQRIFE